MGLRATISGGMTALAIVLAASSAHAQQTAPTTNQATPAPTPTPTNAIGNPALEKFSLPGTVTREAPPPAPANTPPVRSAPAPAASTPTPTPAPAPERTVAPTRTAPEGATPSTPSSSAPSSGLDLAPIASSPSVAAPPVETAPVAAPDLMPPTAPASGGMGLWPWLLALAAALGAGGWWWMRRQREEQELAFAGHGMPEPVAAPRAAPVPQPAPSPAPAPVPRAPSSGFDGGIVSRALQPKLAFDLKPMKFEADAQRNVRLIFELVVANMGSAPARDIRVEARMFNAGPTQDQEIAQFFQAPGAMGAKLPPIPPQDRIPLRSQVMMRAEDYKPVDMGGRPLAIPLMAINAIFRGPSGETQESASWLIGGVTSGEADAAKLKPFGLDKAVSATALAARLHSRGLNR